MGYGDAIIKSFELYWIVAALTITVVWLIWGEK